MPSNNNRGGKREGAGRKRKEYDEKAVMQLAKEFEKEGKRANSNAAKELAFLAYRSEDEGIRLKALKCYFEIMVAKRKEVDISTTFDRPQVYLPSPMEKPPEAIAKEREHATAVH